MNGTGSGGDAQGDTLTNIENLTGSGFDDTLDGDANANVLSGGAGNDTLLGGAGADLLDGGAGLDSLIGGGADDILLWDAADTAIDGGTGTDTLRVDSGDVDLTSFAGTIQGLEQIDLAADAGANAVTLGAQDVLGLSDTDTLTIDGDVGDSVDAGSGWTDGGIAGGYHVYAQGLATLNLDIDLSVNPAITS